MAEHTPQGCKGLQEVIEAGYLETLNVYTEPEGDATRPMVVFHNPLEELDIGLEGADLGMSRVFQLNYCPFCGTKMPSGQPQCGDYT